MNAEHEKKTPVPQLEMVWPEERRHSPPAVGLPADYELRAFRPEDETAYLRLLHAAGFDSFDAEALRHWLNKVLPDGLLLIEHRASGALAATTMATHNPVARHPFGGELGWVAADPAHRGKGLGKAVCAAVTALFLRAGYRRIYLKTDDWRLPAIKIYLDLGYMPFLFGADMEERWRAVCEKLGRPFGSVTDGGDLGGRD